MWFDYINITLEVLNDLINYKIKSYLVIYRPFDDWKSTENVKLH